MIELIHSTKKDISKDKIISISIMKNESIYIQQFIEHYINLGVDHIIIVDNMSTDNSVELTKGYDNVTVYKSDFNFSKERVEIKKKFVENYGKNRWCLMVDIDEFFDFPRIKNINTLHELIDYMKKNNYTASVTYMLDLFSNKKLKENFNIKDNVYYEISNIVIKSYNTQNNFVTSNHKRYSGGIRKTLFNVQPLLLKHSLFYYDKVKIFNEHIIYNANLSDINCVLYHYKFMKNFLDKIEFAIRTQLHYMNSFEYKKYNKIIKNNGNYIINSKNKLKLNHVNDLIKNNFLGF